MSPRNAHRTIVTALAVLAMLLPTAAHAEVVTVRDARGDDPPIGLDIVRAVYDNTGRGIGGAMRFVRLGDRGRASINIQTSDGGDLTYFVLKVRRRADGSVRRRVLYGDRDSTERVPCRLRGGWNRSDDKVRLHVRLRCLRRNGYGRLMDLDYMNFQAVAIRTRADVTRNRFVDRN